MKQSVVDFFIKWPSIPWWREVDDMPYAVWDALRQYLDRG